MTPTDTTAFEVVNVAQFCRLAKRSGTLDGDLPQRAVQGCVPVVEGSAAGFHVTIGDTAVLHVPADDHASASLHTTDEFDSILSQDTAQFAPLLRRCCGPYWADRLSHGFFFTEGAAAFLWTGILVRPRPGINLLVTGAFNRRCEIGIRELVISDSEHFLPLVLEFDLASARDERTFLDTELACVLPLRSDYTITERRLRDMPELGRALVDYADPEYRARRGMQRPTGRYKAIVQRETAARSPAPQAICSIVSSIENLPHRVEPITRVLTTTGVLEVEPASAPLVAATFQLDVDVTIDTLGHGVRTVECGESEKVAAAQAVWTELFGKESLEAVPVLFEQASLVSSPYVSRLVFVGTLDLFHTPPGWSTIFDASHGAQYDGMRGVIATDVLGFANSAIQVLSGSFTIPRGTTHLRALPIPRDLLELKASERSIDEL